MAGKSSRRNPGQYKRIIYYRCLYRCMEQCKESKLHHIELWFENGRTVTVSANAIEQMVEAGKHLQEINKAVETAKWLASLRAEP